MYICRIMNVVQIRHDTDTFHSYRLITFIRPNLLYDRLNIDYIRIYNYVFSCHITIDNGNLNIYVV